LDNLPKTETGIDWLYRNCVGPSPHNLEYYKCLYDRTYMDDKNNKQDLGSKFQFTLEINAQSYMAGCNVANSFRNTSFLHRVPLEKIFADAKIVHVPLVALGKIPPLKKLTEQELQESLADGGQAISNEDLLLYYQASSKEEMSKLLEREDEADDQPSDEEDVFEGMGYPPSAIRCETDDYGHITYFDDDDNVVGVEDEHGNMVDLDKPRVKAEKKKKPDQKVIGGDGKRRVVIEKSDDESDTEDQLQRQKLRAHHDKMRKKKIAKLNVEVPEVVDNTDSDAGPQFALPEIL